MLTDKGGLAQVKHRYGSTSSPIRCRGKVAAGVGRGHDTRVRFPVRRALQARVGGAFHVSYVTAHDRTGPKRTAIPGMSCQLPTWSMLIAWRPWVITVGQAMVQNGIAPRF